jgi:hypothetical protein
MKLKLFAAIALLACASTGLATTSASAQDVINLSGEYTCVQGCINNSPGPVYVTQNGWTMNLVDETGQPTRAWIDRPGHLWADIWHEGATYAPDGSTITFDSGTVWQHGFIPPPPPPPTVVVVRRPVVVHHHVIHHYPPINGS